MMPARPDQGVPGRRRAAPGSVASAMDLPPPDPHKLLEHWLEFERGEAAPGRVLANLKTAGLRPILEQLALAATEAGVTAPDA